jgi:hypothetical protein
MTTETLRCKPLSQCTADDITPMDARLRADCIDYLASNGRSTWNTGAYSLEHLLRLCADVDDSVGVGPGDDGIITICEGGFAGHFAAPSTIARMRADEQAAIAHREARAVEEAAHALRASQPLLPGPAPYRQLSETWRWNVSACRAYECSRESLIALGELLLGGCVLSDVYSTWLRNHAVAA